MINWAIKYQKMGLSVIPLRVRGKEPLIPWTEFQTRRMTMEEIVRQWTRVPLANIGIVTGKISGIAVVDLDGPEGLTSATELGLRSMATYLTGNGKQLWYQYPTESNITIVNSVKKLPGLDIRGEGGYVVAPPSIHPNGKRYRWLNPITAGALTVLPLFPNQLRTVTDAQSPVVTKEEGWISKLLEGMKDGNIDSTFVSILGRLRHDGYSKEDARAFLEPHARRVGAEDGHLEAKIENIWGRYEPKARSELLTVLQNQYINESGLVGTLTIHSPSDNNSWEQFNQSQSIRDFNEEQRLKTGFPKLDLMLTGGLKSSRLTVIGARTGVGKSNFAIGIAKNICEQDKRVLFFSTEMQYQDVWARYIATLKNREEFRQHQFFVCDSFSPNIEKVEEAIIKVKPDVFIFDHINHVSEDVRPLGEFMQGLNWLRRKYNCVGIVTAQLNRAADWVENGKKVEPRLSMIKGSGTIEQAASRVLLLNEVRVTPEMTEIQGILAKNDNGVKGMVMFGLMQNPWRIEEL